MKTALRFPGLWTGAYELYPLNETGLKISGHPALIAAKTSHKMGKTMSRVLVGAVHDTQENCWPQVRWNLARAPADE